MAYYKGIQVSDERGFTVYSTMYSFILISHLYSLMIEPIWMESPTTHIVDNLSMGIHNGNIIPMHRD